MGGYYSKNTKIADKNMDYVIKDDEETAHDKNRLFWFGEMDKNLIVLRSVDE